MSAHFLRATVVVVAVFAADQASKWAVLELLDLRARAPIEVAPLLNFVYALNTGVNFGLFANASALQQQLLFAFAVIVSAALMIWAWRARDNWIAIGCGLVAGGALGNAVDRLRVGAVIDFINMDCCGIGNPYAFNIADAAIFFGAAAIAWSAWGRPETGADRDGAAGPAAGDNETPAEGSRDRA